MRILFIVAHPKFNVGGAEIQAFRIANRLAQRGYEICYLMASPHSNVKKETHISDDQGIGINLFKRSKYFWLSGSLRAYRAIKKIKPDAIYMRGVVEAWPSAIIYGRRKNKRIPVIWQVPSGRSLIKYSNLRELFKTSKLGTIIKNVVDKAIKDLIQLYTIRNSPIIISQTDKNVDILKNVYNRESVKILKGIDIKPGQFKQYSLPLKIYFIRNIKARSRLQLFLSVYDVIMQREDKNKVEFNIIGENQGSFDIKGMIDGKEGIKYHGFLPNDTVLDHLSSAHILIDTLWELEEMTTYSTAFIEAWVNGLVIMSFDTNPDEVLERFQIGFKVQTPEECAEIITNMINDPVLFNEMSARAYSYAKANHDIENEVSALCELIHNY